MQSSTRQMKAAQLKLFQPVQASMRWESLPKEVQQQGVRLLAQLLREHARNQCYVGGKERGNE